MEKARFKVDMQSMDWQRSSPVVRRRIRRAGGWHAFLTSYAAADILIPVMAGCLNSGCDKAMSGWPCDDEIERLRDQFARETDPAKQKEIAAAAQRRNTEFTTHLVPRPMVSAGRDARKNIDGIPDRARAGVLERREKGTVNEPTIKQVLIDRYGQPEEVARCADVPDVGVPSPGEVVFDVLAFPINPADISFCRGTYRLTPTLPATPGAECVGRVTAVGSGVQHVKPGDLVINLQRENWTQKRRVKGDDVIGAPGRHGPPAGGLHAPDQSTDRAPPAHGHRGARGGRLGDPECREFGRGSPAHPARPGARHQDDERRAPGVAVRRIGGARRRRLRRRWPRDGGRREGPGPGRPRPPRDRRGIRPGERRACPRA